MKEWRWTHMSKKWCNDSCLLTGEATKLIKKIFRVPVPRPNELKIRHVTRQAIELFRWPQKVAKKTLQSVSSYVNFFFFQYKPFAPIHSSYSWLKSSNNVCSGHELTPTKQNKQINHLRRKRGGAHKILKSYTTPDLSGDVRKDATILQRYYIRPILPDTRQGKRYQYIFEQNIAT